jgi:hypothetical protein
MQNRTIDQYRKRKGIEGFLFLLVVSSYNTLALSLRESVSSSNEWTEGWEENEELEIKEDFLISSLLAFKEGRDTLKKFFHCSKISIKDAT